MSVAGDTPIQMKDGSSKAISQLEVGDKIVGTMSSGPLGGLNLTPTEVLAIWQEILMPVPIGSTFHGHKVTTFVRLLWLTLCNGRLLVCRADKRWLRLAGQITGCIALSRTYPDNRDERRDDADAVLRTPARRGRPHPRLHPSEHRGPSRS